MITPGLLAIGLGLFSAITVALANYGTKRGGDVLTARMVLSISSALIISPFLFVVPPPPAELWPSVLMAVCIHWVYQFGLVRALHRGDLSRIFPVMRGSSPLLVAIGATFLLEEHLSLLGWLGLIMASFAVIMFAAPESKTMSAAEKELNRAALFWAGVTAFGIAAYSITDASVIRTMPSPYTFIVYLFALDWIGITIVTLIMRRGQVWAHVKPQLRGGIMGGAASVLSFSAALYAFTLTDAALVTALRETSVVWAALMGAIWLKEGFGRRRVIAATVLATGLIMMKAFG
ncbi:MAG: DMT family transporter [Hyphomonadaceae bacterium]